MRLRGRKRPRPHSAALNEYAGTMIHVCTTLKNHNRYPGSSHLFLPRLMHHSAPSWQHLADVKRASLFDAIPAEWRLHETQVYSAEELNDVTSFITTFLSPREQQITASSALTIMKNVQCSTWSAVDVIRAFCHRAALAHQLVWIESKQTITLSLTSDRLTASQRSVSRRLSTAL